MLYRENGQFKTSYRADLQIFPILQDRAAIGLLLAFAFVVVPLAAPEYLLRAVLLPFLILSLAALGNDIEIDGDRARAGGAVALPVLARARAEGGVQEQQRVRKAGGAAGQQLRQGDGGL